MEVGIRSERPFWICRYELNNIGIVLRRLYCRPFVSLLWPQKLFCQRQAMMNTKEGNQSSTWKKAGATAELWFTVVLTHEKGIHRNAIWHILPYHDAVSPFNATGIIVNVLTTRNKTGKGQPDNCKKC